MRMLLKLPALAALLCVAGTVAAQPLAPPCPSLTADCLLSEAAALAGAVARSGPRDEIHFSVATALAALGRLDDAMAMADQIADPYTRAEAFGEIAAAAARAGAFDRAYAIALTIVDARSRSARLRSPRDSRCS